jgi:hypothetical protein
MNCSRCHRPIPTGHLVAGCPFCGHRAELESARADGVALSPSARRIAFLVFWVAFLGGPILTFLFARTMEAALLFPVLGAIISGVALAKACTRTVAGSILASMAFSLGALVIYVGVFFAGCLGAVSR